MSAKLPTKWKYLDDFVNQEVTAYRVGWDVEPDDDHDVAWKDPAVGDGVAEVTGIFSYITVPNPEIGLVALVGTLPVDPKTVKLVEAGGS